MDTVDFWQLIGMTAAVIFTFGFVDQLRISIKSRDVSGLSLLQWLIFVTASAMFIAYYIHLQQWLMVAVSSFGTLCCLLQCLLIMMFRQQRLANRG